MLNHNQVELCGVVGDVKIFEKPGKKPFAKISLATNTRYVNGDEVIEKTQWHHLHCFDNMVKIVKEKVCKGRQLLVMGHLGYNKWQSPEGVEIKSAIITAHKLYVLDSLKKNDMTPEAEAWIEEYDAATA